ncbi:hypothetical protein SAMN05216302_1004131 [Nitrosomonas aestuarii]|uniref:Uncharacterized protein n=1 Tax=Nitrosomonas aestuarii TaxID=52441 RepID=A0A1I3YSC5_9PROT|nr:hypothetical protein SAMN05216302_1004131 [Nitrosomonas aestuarii]
MFVNNALTIDCYDLASRICVYSPTDFEEDLNSIQIRRKINLDQNARSLFNCGFSHIGVTFHFGNIKLFQGIQYAQR